MSVRDSTILSIALLVGMVAVVMHMLGAKIPVTHLPEGAFLFSVIGT